jgi:hypothetical protein
VRGFIQFLRNEVNDYTIEGAVYNNANILFDHCATNDGLFILEIQNANTRRIERSGIYTVRNATGINGALHPSLYEPLGLDSFYIRTPIYIEEACHPSKLDIVVGFEYVQVPYHKGNLGISSFSIYRGFRIYNVWKGDPDISGQERRIPDSPPLGAMCRYSASTLYGTRLVRNLPRDRVFWTYFPILQIGVNAINAVTPNITGGQIAGTLYRLDVEPVPSVWYHADQVTLIQYPPEAAFSRTANTVPMLLLRDLPTMVVGRYAVLNGRVTKDRAPGVLDNIVPGSIIYENAAHNLLFCIPRFPERTTLASLELTRTLAGVDIHIRRNNKNELLVGDLVHFGLAVSHFITHVLPDEVPNAVGYVLSISPRGKVTIDSTAHPHDIIAAISLQGGLIRSLYYNWASSTPRSSEGGTFPHAYAFEYDFSNAGVAAFQIILDVLNHYTALIPG